MFRRIDRSQTLLRLLGRMSDLFAKQRGLPIIIGIMLIILSMVVQSINVFVDANLLELVGTISLHLGILIALIGIALVEPLGGR